MEIPPGFRPGNCGIVEGSALKDLDIGEGPGIHHGSGRLASNRLLGNRKELLEGATSLVEPGLRSLHWWLG